MHKFLYISKKQQKFKQKDCWEKKLEMHIFLKSQ